ncbi:MAG: CehA/McbA family metallohydrolase [Solirubrobacterales bacterium]
MNGRTRIGCGLLAGIVACLLAPSVATATDCPLPGSPGTGMNPAIDVQGDIAAAKTGGYLQIPFTVPPNTTGIQVRYSYDNEGDTCSGNYTLDMGVYEPRANTSDPVWEQTDRRGWSGSAVKNLAIAENGFSSEDVYNGGNGTNQRKNFVDGRTTRAYQPGPIPMGNWAVELGIAYIDPADANGIHYHVQVLTSTDPAWGNDTSYTPSGPPAEGDGLQDGWFFGDLHVHGEQEPGNATMKQTFDAAFGPGGANLDFVTLVDHNNNVAHNDMKTQSDVANSLGGLVIPGVEVTTYKGHWNNQGSNYFADFRAGPIYSGDPSPDDQIDDSELVKVADGVKPKDEMAAAQAGGGWTQINHPALAKNNPSACRGCAWSYSDDDTDFSKVDAIEISNSIGALQAGSPFTTDAIAYYEHALDSGAHIAAVGSSDAHKAGTDPISPVGQGATAVFGSPGLSRTGIVNGVKGDNTYVLPFGSSGPLVDFEATSDTDPTAIIGESVSGHSIELSANIDRTPAAARPGTWELTLLQDGVAIDTTPITTNTINQTWDVTESGRYSVEVTRTEGSEFIEAYTSPIWVTVQPKPSNKITLGKPKLDKKKGTAKLPVTVPGGGELKLTGKSVAGASASPAKASKVQLAVRPTGKLKKTLKKKGKATAKVTVSFTPTGGDARKASTRVKLVKKKR